MQDRQELCRVHSKQTKEKKKQNKKTSIISELFVILAFIWFLICLCKAAPISIQSYKRFYAQ